MKRTPVILFAGERSIAIPYSICLFALIVLVVACAATVVNSVLPHYFGTPPILPIPVMLQNIANVLAYFTAVAAMMVLMMFLFGLLEDHQAAGRFTDFQRLVPLPDLLTSQITIAPNVDEADRDSIITALQQLAGHGCISSIIAPVSAGDIVDGSIDRLFVTTTLGGTEFRRMIRNLKCDDVSKVPKRCTHQIAKKAQFGEGTIWLMTWD